MAGEGATERSAESYAVLALGASMLVLVIKLAAWLWTGSMVLLADAAESGLDLVTALLLVFSVRLSAQPADEGHPFGHGKVEYFSSGFQGALVFAAGGGVAIEALRRVGEHAAPVELGVGLVLSTVATMINIGLSVVLVRAGRRLRSPALEADGHHNATDVYTTVGGWCGLGLAWATGLWLLDSLVALVVAAQIGWTGVGLIRAAVAGLMDAALPPDELQELVAALNNGIEGEPEVCIENVRTRVSSHRTFVDCILVVPGSMTVSQSHALCDRVEAAAEAAIAGVDVQIHVEPLHG